MRLSLAGTCFVGALLWAGCGGPGSRPAVEFEHRERIGCERIDGQLFPIPVRNLGREPLRLRLEARSHGEAECRIVGEGSLQDPSVAIRFVELPPGGSHDFTLRVDAAGTEEDRTLVALTGAYYSEEEGRWIPRLSAALMLDFREGADSPGDGS